MGMLLYNLDSVLRGDPHFMMGVLEKQVMDTGSKAEKANLLLNIRNLVTLWGPGNVTLCFCPSYVYYDVGSEDNISSYACWLFIMNRQFV